MEFTNAEKEHKVTMNKIVWLLEQGKFLEEPATYTWLYKRSRLVAAENAVLYAG